MPLPFFDHKKTVSIIIAQRGKPSVEVTPEVEMGDDKVDPGLKSAAEDVLSAIQSKSVVDLAKALRAAWEVCENYEPEEMGDE